MDDDDDEINEDIEEEDLNIESDHAEQDSNPWDLYADNDPDGDIDDTTEDTALLRTQTIKTEIIVTPISPVSLLEMGFSQNLKPIIPSFQVNSSQNLARMGGSSEDYNPSMVGGSDNGNSSLNSKPPKGNRSMDLLTPDMAQRQCLLDSSGEEV